jgi:LytS/YehU family sensor histidine kinase
MTYTTLLGLSYALHYSRESQARAVKEAQLETSLVQARLRTLEAELHPHFLFNTLHAISSLVHTNPDGADRMISRLSDLLRLTFDDRARHACRFRRNWSSCRSTRRSNRPASRPPHGQVRHRSETLDAEVPRLILQPLVENAIKHGVSPKPGAGLVQITARRKGENLWIEVSDNGVGLSAGARARLRSGVGLSNTRDRLECLYGTAHRIEFSDGSRASRSGWKSIQAGTGASGRSHVQVA